MPNLVIIESPTKAPTIKSYLGANYKVVASNGHVRDLPKSTLGVDIENNFLPRYINIRGRGDLIKSIKKEAKAATKVYLATDPDREGEAISWHLAAALDLPEEKTMRVTFNEINKTAVKAAIKNPRKIDMNLVNAQQARRILDRIVGYKLSPYLWKRVKSGLSAGRVQSVATRIIVDREEEIRAFVPVEYWTIFALLACAEGREIKANFYGREDGTGKMKVSNREEAERIISAVEGKSFTVKSIKRGTKHKAPAPPFTTSTLQQEASRKLGFQSARTMRIAQELYEGIGLGSENGGVQGLITYMRTDSLRVSADAQSAAKDFITGKYGENYCPATPRIYKSRSSAQDAHEAIRPSRLTLEPAAIRRYLTPDQFKLYKLIWERFVASQMQSAELSTVTADFASAGYIFRTSGYTVTFPGYMAVYVETEDENRRSGDDGENENDSDSGERDLLIPDIKEGQSLDCRQVKGDQHFTEPPPRYTEASLIKFLEEKGIGRPSTYTPTISTIINRNYVSREGRALAPTPLGEITTALMKENFPDIVNYRFTADIEAELDAIENGSEDMLNVLKKFWAEFERELEAAAKDIDGEGIALPVVEADIDCEKCGSRMVIKTGRFGKFAACPNYPKCRNTKPLEEAIKSSEIAAEDKKEKPEKKLIYADFKCEKCGGDMVQRTGKFGSFYACINYPNCKFTKQKTKDIDVACPNCGSKVVMKYGRNRTVFYSCDSYPECDFSSWDIPTNEKCPRCGAMLFKRKGRDILFCRAEGCGFEKQVESESEDQNGKESKDENEG